MTAPGASVKHGTSSFRSNDVNSTNNTTNAPAESLNIHAQNESVGTASDSKQMSHTNVVLAVDAPGRFIVNKQGQTNQSSTSPPTTNTAIPVNQRYNSWQQIQSAYLNSNRPRRIGGTS